MTESRDIARQERAFLIGDLKELVASLRLELAGEKAENEVLREALRGVIDVADRHTVEFDRARALTRKPGDAR